MAAGKGRTSRLLVWLLLGLLIVGLAGFGVDSFGGRVRTIGQVGDRDITTTEYFRALQQEIRAFEAQIGQSVPFQTALALGLDRTVRERLVTIAALDDEARRIGLSVGDDTVRAELLKITAFHDLSGRFDPEAYRLVLRQNGYEPREFEAQLRADTARTLLQAGVIGAAGVPDSFTEAVAAHLAEQRAFRFARLTAPSQPLEEPDDATLRRYYEEHAGDFTLPEGRRIAYAWASPAALAERVTVDEGAIRDLYDRRISEYVQPERRLVERLVFATEAEARAAMARLEADESLFPDLVAERGLTLADVDMGDVAEAELGPAGPAVFALAGPGVVGPLPSPLGPAIYRMNGILAAQEVTFEEAREELRTELATERARRQIQDSLPQLQDLLAGGATLDDLARELGMERGEITYRPGVAEGIAAYTAFRRAAPGLSLGGFPEVVEFDDGGVAVLRLEEIVPAAQEPFEDVVVRVIEGWAATETARRLVADAETLAGRLRAGEAPETLGVAFEAVDGVARDGVVEGLPRAALAAVFEMAPGEVRSLPAAGEVVVLILDEIIPADPADPEVEALRALLRAQAAQGMAQDHFNYFAAAVERQVGIRFDDAAIAAVHAQFQ